LTKDSRRLGPAPLILWHDVCALAADDLNQATLPQLARRAPDRHPQRPVERGKVGFARQPLAATQLPVRLVAIVLRCRLSLHVWRSGAHRLIQDKVRLGRQVHRCRFAGPLCGVRILLRTLLLRFVLGHVASRPS